MLSTQFAMTKCCWQLRSSSRNFFLLSTQCDSSSLMWGDEVVESAEGVQQGDPLGPLLFCLSIHKMAAKLKSELAIFYLDDGTLGGNWEDVVNDMKMIEDEARDLGLLLNRSKTELIIMFGSHNQGVCFVQFSWGPGH